MPPSVVRTQFPQREGLTGFDPALASTQVIKVYKNYHYNDSWILKCCYIHIYTIITWILNESRICKSVNESICPRSRVKILILPLIFCASANPPSMNRRNIQTAQKTAVKSQ